MHLYFKWDMIHTEQNGAMPHWTQICHLQTHHLDAWDTTAITESTELLVQTKKFYRIVSNWMQADHKLLFRVDVKSDAAIWSYECKLTFFLRHLLPLFTIRADQYSYLVTSIALNLLNSKIWRKKRFRITLAFIILFKI